MTIFIILFLLIYIFIYFNRNKIETNITFKGLGKKSTFNYQEYGFEEINILDKNGNNIHGIYYNNNKEKTIFYFHGNSGPLSDYMKYMKSLINLGYNLISFDYPGYGKSEGFPLEGNIYEYTNIFFNYIKKVKFIKNSDIIVIGYSIGTALAINFNFKNNIDKIILIAPFSSSYDMCKFKYNIIIQKYFFMKNSFNNIEKVKSILNPILIIHGNIDNIIPINHGINIYNNIKSKNKYFLELKNRGHLIKLKNENCNITENITDFLIYGSLKNKYTVL